jgi:hypothetical protein
MTPNDDDIHPALLYTYNYDGQTSAPPLSVGNVGERASVQPALMGELAEYCSKDERENLGIILLCG